MSRAAPCASTGSARTGHGLCGELLPERIDVDERGCPVQALHTGPARDR
ncbi:hypothetical protein [Streptomyces spinosirectus]